MGEIPVDALGELVLVFGEGSGGFFLEVVEGVA
jgi:hypothetical protein